MSGGVLVLMVFVQVVFVRGGFCPYTLLFTSKFPCPVCRHLHFPKCNSMPFSDHLTHLF